MKQATRTGTTLLLAAALLLTGATAGAQFQDSRLSAANIVVPQRGAFRTDPRLGVVGITGVRAGVRIRDRVATTTLDIALRNPSRSRLEAELLVPVPEGAVVRGFDFQGAAAEPTAELLLSDEARRTYDSIVAAVRDPALLEFAGYSLIRSSVFPVEGGGTQTVRLVYEQILPAVGDRVDYLLPRSESLDYRVPWRVSVRIEASGPVSTVYSPTHDLDTDRKGPRVVLAELRPGPAHESGPFRLSYLRERDGLTASLFAYREQATGGGYFLLLAGLPTEPALEDMARVRREVTLVLDRSGSMRGEKLEQVRNAALQVLHGLKDGESFNLITYGTSVDLFSGAPVQKNAATLAAAARYLEGVRASGGTNLHDALVAALRQPADPASLPVVLFLTDGLPTVGQTSERAIRETAARDNPHGRRIFTLGVGVDVNAPLLDAIAEGSRASSTYVLPGEAVEERVSDLFARLHGPVFSDLQMDVSGAAGRAGGRPVQELIPATLPDLFEGDQFVLMGRYTGEGPLTFRIRGNLWGARRSFRFHFGLDDASTENAFVPRLWAGSRIAELVDAVRQLGAGDAAAPHRADVESDPRYRELVDEIVRLSTRYGILTEYTSFLAREGTDLADWGSNRLAASRNLTDRAVAVRSGVGALNQSMQISGMKKGKLASQKGYLDREMNAVQVTEVQQVHDLALYNKGGQWVDSRVAGKGEPIRPDVVVEYGSPEFRDLLRRLSEQGRQGAVALDGEILLQVDGRRVLVKGAKGR